MNGTENPTQHPKGMQLIPGFQPPRLDYLLEGFLNDLEISLKAKSLMQSDNMRIQLSKKKQKPKNSILSILQELLLQSYANSRSSVSVNKNFPWENIQRRQSCALI